MEESPCITSTSIETTDDQDFVLRTSINAFPDPSARSDATKSASEDSFELSSSKISMSACHSANEVRPADSTLTFAFQEIEDRGAKEPWKLVRPDQRATARPSTLQGSKSDNFPARRVVRGESTHCDASTLCSFRLMEQKRF